MTANGKSNGKGKEGKTIENRLEEVAHSIIALKRHHSVLFTLFALEPGYWEELRVLCEGTDDFEGHFEVMENYEEGAIYVDVNWLPFPQSAYGAGYAVITFFCESLHWYYIALYNRQALLDGHFS